MSLFKLLIEKFLTENKCCPTLSEVLVPKVASWVDKNTKINVSDRGSITENLLKCSAGQAHGGHRTLDGRWGGLDARGQTPGGVQGTVGGEGMAGGHPEEERTPVALPKDADEARTNESPEFAKG